MGLELMCLISNYVMTTPEVLLTAELRCHKIPETTPFIKTKGLFAHDFGISSPRLSSFPGWASVEEG